MRNEFSNQNKTRKYTADKQKEILLFVVFLSKYFVENPAHAQQQMEHDDTENNYFYGHDELV
ncbi:hypothetical protein SAMN05421780_101373 [Flexibacter flexilis DSM 6793]|uniref:Uncharacterized protein n=1 Tax=Flexibacter flexilis DSM 6793 TaxID=927664 RepID=A0A1I1DP24_9BACT|nr:hypothetical protein [Flexibacter flexilis]SFB76715.1 hypothetical protein SAMN05421780_101373 [Flexibacter flexilis DSM 6793]